MCLKPKLLRHPEMITSICCAYSAQAESKFFGLSFTFDQKSSMLKGFAIPFA